MSAQSRRRVFCRRDALGLRQRRKVGAGKTVTRSIDEFRWLGPRRGPFPLCRGKANEKLAGGSAALAQKRAGKNG